MPRIWICDGLEQMKAKIGEDMNLKNEHVNINIDNFSIISKLYVDNNFDLPHKTIEYLADQEAEKLNNPAYKQYLVHQYRMQIAQEMVSMYIMNNLRKAIPLELSDEMVEEYMIHEAILEDMSAEAYKEKYKDELDHPSYRKGITNYFILRNIAKTCEFTIVEENTEEAEIPEAETSEATEE